jgi:hypothetical protein
LSKFKCGKCFKGFEELQAFGDHACVGDNAFLAALGNGGTINLGEFSIDLSACVEESIHQHKVKSAIENLENGFRRSDP